MLNSAPSGRSFGSLRHKALVASVAWSAVLSTVPVAVAGTTFGGKGDPGGLFAAAEARTENTTLTWTGKGGDGLWSTPANWKDANGTEGVAPVSGIGDTLVFDATDGDVTVYNDMSELAIAKICFHGLVHTVTVDGSEFVLDSELCWTNGTPTIINAPFKQVDAIGERAKFEICSDLTLNGDLTFEKTTGVTFVGRRTNTTGATTKNQLTATFNGAINGPQATLYLAMANGNTAYLLFHGKLTLECLRNAVDWGGPRTTVSNPANVIANATFAYQTFNLTDDALHGTVLKPDGDSPADVMLNLTAGKTYVFDRLSEIGDKWEWTRRTDTHVIGTTSAATPTEVILRGTDNATTACRLGAYAMNLTWDPEGDFVQEFRNRTHEQTGALTVRRGTVRLTGENVFKNVTKAIVRAGARLEINSTSAQSFPALKRLSLGENARLSLGSSEVHPFAPDAVVAVLSAGAKLVVPTDAVLELGRLVVDGQEVAAADYTRETWMEGDGTVRVSGAASSVKMWLNPAGGDWADADNWLGKTLPVAGDAVVVAADGDYTVNLKGTDAVPGELELSDLKGTATLKIDGNVSWPSGSVEVGEGGRILVPTGSVLTVSNGTKIDVNGGTFRVDGGDMSVTNFTGDFSVSSYFSVSGRLELAAGRIRHCADVGDNNYPITIAKGGVFGFSGGRFESLMEYKYAMCMSGGKVEMSGDAVYTDGAADWIYMIFNENETVLDGNAHLENHNGSTYFTVCSSEAGEKAILTVKGLANLNGGEGCARLGTMQVGTFNNSTVGEGELNLDADVDYSGGNSTQQAAYSLNIGTPNGTGTVNLRNGCLSLAGRGVRIGTSNGGKWGTYYSGGDGTLNVLGGVLGIAASKVDEGQLYGLMVGQGGAFDMSKAKDVFKPWTGRFRQTAGIVTNLCNTCVGGPRATGNFEQTGGLYRGGSFGNAWDAELYPFVVGAGGGTGRCLLGGGTTQIGGDVYVGGVFTSAFRQAETGTLAEYGWPIDDHSAVGTLTITGGTVTAECNLLVGIDGKGTVEVGGSLATVSFKHDLILSNTTTKATSSSLRFVADANGISPLQFAGKVVNTPGTKLTVDLVAYRGDCRKLYLVTCAAWEGAPLADEDVTLITRPDVGDVTYGTDRKGLYARIRSGSLIIVR